MKSREATTEGNRQPRYVTRLVHPTYQLVASACPNCGFPEAEGGYCPECGWTRPYKRKEGKNGLQH